MAPEETSLPEEILRDRRSDVAKLRKMGITDYAIFTYLSRVREGRSKEKALRGLLQGRGSLTDEQQQLVRTILDRLPLE